MRSHHPRRSWRLWTLGVLTFALLALPQVALAQLTIDPTATPTRNTGGWVYWMAEGAIALGALVLIMAGAAYLRFAPRFYRTAREEQAKGTAVPAPEASSIRIQYTPPPQPVAPAAAPAPEPVPAGVVPAATAPTSTVAAPAAAPAAAAQPAAAPAAPRPATPRQEGPVELDQETFDRVLKEQLDKGTDRRVAEGRARSAAVKAAREKAGG
jgi:hypothetical protein